MKIQRGKLDPESLEARRLKHNNTVFDNDKYGISIHYKSLNTEIRNNIIYKNGGSPISLSGGTVEYASSHNLTTDPLFSNAPTDFSLRANSSAINAGMKLPAVRYDFIGTLRPQGAGYDIGAYEFISIPQLPVAPSNLRLEK